MSIKKFFNFLIFGKISLGHKDQSIFEEKATDENSMGYMDTMFPFSPPGENNNKPPAVEEISDRFGAQNYRLTQVKRKRDAMIFGDEPLFKKHKHFASVLKVDPTTELKISLAEPPTTNNRRPVGVVVRSAPVDIPKKRCIQLL
eukprot:XP_016660946.1 PREDICTED: uncharacterized protein LOC103309793 [Acyrthosiphon pisum]